MSEANIGSEASAGSAAPSPSDSPDERAAIRDVMRMARGGRRGDRRWLVGSATGFSLHQLAEVAVPVLIGISVQSAADDAPVPVLIGCLLALVGVFALLITGWRVGLLSGVHLATRVEHRLRRRLMDSALQQTAKDSARLISIATADVDRVGMVAIVVGRGIAAGAALLASLVVLFFVSWPLALVILVAAVLQLITVDRIGRRLEARVAAEQQELGAATAQAADLVSGVRVLHGINGTAAAVGRYRVASRRALAAGAGRLRAQSGISAVGQAIAAAAFVLTAAIAAQAGLAGSIGPGDLVTVVGIAAMLPIPLATLVGAAVEMAAARGAAGRIAAVTGSLGDDVTSPVAADRRARPDGRLENVDDRSTDVEGNLVIRHEGVEARVGRGELVGLRADGHWAESIAASIRQGEVSIADQLAADRAVVYAPPQLDRVFTGTVADNLFATLDPSLIVTAGVDDVLDHLPDGVASSVGEQGRRLSGGQRQRLLLARALHQPQPFLLLHEPLSSVDALTAERIVRAMAEHARMRRRGILLSTSQQRLLAFCDRVLAPSDGGRP